MVSLMLSVRPDSDGSHGAEQYKEWFYVNLHTKQSQWDRPTSPVYPPSGDGAPPGPPPSYNHGDSRGTGPEKGGLGSNNPYGQTYPTQGSQNNVSDDEAYARKLQEEEDARARAGQGSRGAADSYYQGGASAAPQYGQSVSPAPYAQQQQLPPRDQAAGASKGGFLSKLMGKSSSSRPQQSYGPSYGGYPSHQQQQEHYQHQQPQAGYSGYPPQQYQQQYQQQPQKKAGMSAGTGALLGGGAGLLGGMLLMDEIDDHEQQSYDQGYDQGVSSPKPLAIRM